MNFQEVRRLKGKADVLGEGKMIETFFSRLQILEYVSVENKELVDSKKLKIYEGGDH